jgi:predicted nucleic acid-binding protein
VILRGRSYRLRVAEPLSAYSHRPPLVVDASVLAAALFEERARAEAVALLHGRSLHAPHLIDFEIASVGLKKLTQDRVPRDAVAGALDAFRRVPIERHSVEVDRVIELARTYGLTVYDAAYLCVADELEAPLATLDGELGDAAHRHLTSAKQVHEPRQGPRELTADR